jgi:diguanylate cyclase (GGDEF)-like protein
MNEKQAIGRLLALTRRLLDGLELDLALQTVCDAALELLPGEHASIRILDNSGTRLLSGARSGAGLDQKPLNFKLGEGVIGWSVEHRQTVRLDDATTDRRFKQAQAQGFDIRALLTVPLWCGGRVVGVLGVTAPEAARFGEEEESLALLLANCVAPYIEKARLERLSITDPQTMAFNRNYLLPRLREEFERAQRNETNVSLLIMALGGLQEMEDSSGRAVAERALVSFADRVRASVRLSDILVRRDAETFALIMPDMNVGPASVVADRICHSVTEYPLEVGAVDLGLALGVARWNGKETDGHLLQRAMLAVKESRARGGNVTIRARHFAGRQLDAATHLTCLRESCKAPLEEVPGDRTYHRCTSQGCRSIWFFG